MAYEEKAGTGAIFKNNKLKDTHPDYRGSIITPSGEKLDVSLWVKEAKSGTKYFFVSVQEPFKKESAPSPTLMPKQQIEELPSEIEDDLPF